MTTGGKVALGIVGGLVLLLILGGGACIYVFSRYGKEFAEDAKRRQNEGKSYGQTGDNAACLKEALDRSRKDNSLTSIISVNIFLATCLKESKPSPGFCDGVPPLNNALGQDQKEIKAWVSRKCAEAHQSGKTCEGIFTVVQTYCDGLLDNHGDDPGKDEESEPAPGKKAPDG